MCFSKNMCLTGFLVDLKDFYGLLNVYSGVCFRLKNGLKAFYFSFYKAVQWTLL